MAQQDSLWDGVLHSQIAGTFMGADLVAPNRDALRQAGAKSAVYGIPWEASTSRAGASYGPRGIRDVSWQFSPHNGRMGFDVLLDGRMVDCGNTQVIPGNAEETFSRAQFDISELLGAGVFPVMFGGDHSVTIPGVRAVAEAASRPGLVFVDAHLDSAPDLLGETLSHASPVARAFDAGFAAENVALVGMNGWGVPPREIEYVKERGMTVFWIEDVWSEGAEAIAAQAYEVASRGADSIYLSVDIDCLDVGVAPGTGSPTPGGLTSRELITIVRTVASRGLAAMDVTEVAPTLDPSPSGTQTTLMAARVALEGLAWAAGARSERQAAGQIANSA